MSHEFISAVYDVIPHIHQPTIYFTHISCQLLPDDFLFIGNGIDFSRTDISRDLIAYQDLLYLYDLFIAAILHMPHFI